MWNVLTIEKMGTQLLLFDIGRWQVLDCLCLVSDFPAAAHPTQIMGQHNWVALDNKLLRIAIYFWSGVWAAIHLKPAGLQNQKLNWKFSNIYAKVTFQFSNLKPHKIFLIVFCHLKLNFCNYHSCCYQSWSWNLSVFLVLMHLWTNFPSPQTGHQNTWPVFSFCFKFDKNKYVWKTFFLQVKYWALFFLPSSLWMHQKLFFFLN